MSDYTWTDSDHNGTYDTGYADLDRNGSWDIAVMDLTGDHVIDAYLYDQNGNMVFGDEIRFDLDQDGVTDFVLYDSDEDGVTDAYADPSTGWQPVAAAPPSASFGHTVMPMQGAYWSGVEGESTQMLFLRLLQTETDPFTRAQLLDAVALLNLRGW